MIANFKVGGVPEHFNLPWQLVIRQGDFEKKSIFVQWQNYPGGTGAMVKDLQSGLIDVAVGLSEGIVKHLTQDNHSKIIQLYVKSPLNWGIHIAGNSTIKDIAELKGKKYAISRLGSGSHLMAYIDADLRGWNPKEQQLEIVGDLQGGLEALRTGKAEVFMWEKFITKPFVDKGELKRIGECLTPWPCFVIAARNEVLKEKREALNTLLQIIRKACFDFKSNPNSLEIVCADYHLNNEDAKAWLRETHWTTDNKIWKKDLEKVIDTLFDLEFTDKKLKPAALCDTSFCELI